MKNKHWKIIYHVVLAFINFINYCMFNIHIYIIYNQILKTIILQHFVAVLNLQLYFKNSNLISLHLIRFFKQFVDAA